MPPSRPTPEWREPPKGACRSRTKKQLTQTVPATSRAVTRSARSGSPVTRVAASPKRVSLASRTASSSVGEGLQGQDRAEDLLLHDLRVLGDVGEQGRRVVQAVLAVAADDRAGPGRDGAPHEAVDLLQLARVDVRPDVGGLVARVALLQRRGLLDEAAGELLGDRLLDQDAGRGQAHLAGVVVLLHREVDGQVQVGVGEHQQR